jgi:phosphoserine phosphatase RsbU/P
MSQHEQKISEAPELEDQLDELALKLETERKLNEDKTAIMKKTIAETEELARHLQNTTLALIQERQIANARAEKEKLLNKWIEKINSSFDLDSLLLVVVKEINDYLKASRCGVILFDKEEIITIKENTKADYKRKLENIPTEDLKKNSFIRKIIRTRSAVLENSLNDLEEKDLFLDRVKSLSILPFAVKYEQADNDSTINEIVGLIYLQECKEDREWLDREIDLLQSILLPLGTAIEKVLLYQEARQRTKYAELLNNLTAQIRSSLNLSEILARTVNELGIAFKASRCFLYFDGYISDEYCADGVHSIADETKYLILDKFRQSKSFKAIAINNLLSKENLSLLSRKEIEQLESSKALAALACPLHFQGIMQGWIVFHDINKRKWTRDEIAFVESAASQVIVAMTQSRMYEKLNSYQEKLSRELKQAAQVQTSLIGGDVFDVNLKTSVFYKAHSNVSGDFYWVAELAPDTVGVLIGDVSGKGPAAALLTGYLLGEFNAAVANSALAWFPDKLISFLCHSILHQNSSSDFYATAWYGVFDLNAGTLKYTNAGHLNPYIIQNGSVSQLGDDKSIGMPLGLINPKEIEEAYEARLIDFKAGDKMILFTDGVLDQKMPNGQFVPKNWVKDTLEHIKDLDVKEITSELNHKLNEMSDSTPLSDDRLMISLEQVAFDIQEFAIKDQDKTEKLIEQIIREALSAGLPEKQIINLRLGITEALANAVRYGLERNPYGDIRLGYKIKQGSFKMSIIDPGPGFNWQVYNNIFIDEVRFDNEGGRGIPLLLEIFDKVTWNYLGNHIGLFFYW